MRLQKKHGLDFDLTRDKLSVNFQCARVGYQNFPVIATGSDEFEFILQRDGVYVAEMLDVVESDHWSSGIARVVMYLNASVSGASHQIFAGVPVLNTRYLIPVLLEL